jgi:hypothetical protein
MPKLSSISLVLPKGFNMWVLQILALPSLRLGLLESPKINNTYIVNIQYKCQAQALQCCHSQVCHVTQECD